MKKNYIITFIIIQSVFTSSLFADDYVYLRNFVKHADEQSCNHLPPDVTFTVYLNQDHSHVLTEEAPRWVIGGDPNIPGNGSFGVEMGNFDNPVLQVGDSVFIRFTCNQTNQQAILTSQCNAIPWVYFPSFLTLIPVTLPQAPQNVTLIKDSLTFFRTISWTQQAAETYSVYRRVYSDTIAGGEARMQYFQLADNISGNLFVDSTAQVNEKYGYIVYAKSNSGVISSHSEEVNEDPYVAPGSDLTISYIARLPRIDYVWGSSNPAVEGWPAVGSTVQWHAVVKNWLDSALVDVQYKWIMDGAIVDSGTVDFPAQDTAYVDYPWSWTFDRHNLKFVIDPNNLVPEEEEENNELLIYTNAIGAGFYVEQSVYDYFHQYQKELGVHSNCWGDWAQRHVKMWNQMFENAIFSLAPNGVLDRIRLDKITVVPDGALPLAGGLPSNNPNLNDRTIDLQWGFPATLLNGSFYSNHTSVSTNNPFYFEGSLMHELGHARYLIDIYGFNVHDNGNGNNIAIMENGNLIVGTQYMPLMGDIAFPAPYQGLMNGQYTYMDEYSAVAMNLIAGQRAILGNYNAPGNIGVFLQDLSNENRLTVKDNSGNPLPNANVRIYQATGQPGVWYGKYYDNIPDLEFTADDSGAVEIGRCPFDNDGTIDHTYGLANGVMILRVQHGQKVGYGFLCVTDFNMQFWAGHTTLGEYELQVNLINPSWLADNNDSQIPEKFQLEQNYPNPFNPITVISYHLPTASKVELSIFSVLGQKVTTLISKNQKAGVYQYRWDASDFTSGVYYYQIKIDHGFSQTKKMVLMK